MRRAVLGLCSLLLTQPVAAEPCAMMGLESRALRPDTSVSPEGGIVIGELPTMINDTKPTPDRSSWKVRVKGKEVTAKVDPIAPGLVVYRPPAGATTYEVMNAKNKRAAQGKLAKGTAAALLDAPRVTAVVSGESHGRHPSVFVNVEIEGVPPKTAIALVLSKAKGAALSWGQVSPEASVVNVYSTGGGCVSKFSDGTVVAQPGELVVAFWVDELGRRSRVSPTVVVDKAP